MGAAIDPHCRAFQTAIEVLSRPWNALILGMLQDGPLRFSELEARSRGLGPKTLSARLKSLEASGILARRIEPGPPIRVQYSLTGRGLAFQRVAEAIERWGRDLVAGADSAADSPAPARPRKAGVRSR